MTEYIKRDDAILRMCACFRFTQQMSSRILEAVPTADVVPRELYQRALSDVVTLSVERKHGKMLTNEFGYESCSVCHYGLMLFITDENNTLRKPNFCPNCGAQMGKDIPMEYFESGGK